ncbi:MAG: AAA family ATPase, partial [Candidatus Paceibacterota bacterium]
MLKKVEMTCFRKHESRTVAFTDGLNVIRAANEGGKTTLIEAVTYALFGSRVLRDSLDDTVTWGHLTKDLNVVVEYGDYTISRSKNSAEVVSMGQVFVTGQTEVTRFCEALVGCDATTAAHLMLATQTSLKGILEGGPKATATLIEDLGEFDLFDRLLDAAQHKLALGSSAVQEDRVRNLTQQLSDLPELTKPEALDVSQMANDRGKLEAAITSTYKPQLASLSEAYQAELAVLAKVETFDAELRRVEAQIKEVATEVATERAAVPAPGEVVDT